MFEIEFEHERFTVDDKAIQLKIDAAIIAFLDDIADFAYKSFHAHVPHGETLRLAGAIHKDRVEKIPGGFSVSVGIHPIEKVGAGESPNYPLFVDEGTGLFGPKRKLIKPVHGNVMVFHVAEVRGFAAIRAGLFGEPGDAGGTIITQWVEGQHAQHFSELVEKESTLEFKIKKRELAKFLSKIIADH